MLIIPAIDLLEGQAVRLYKGDYAQKTIYSKDPVALARKFQHMGAPYLHIVDLDGAKAGKSKNHETIKAIRQKVNIPMQVGGGIRTLEAADRLIDNLKVSRIIIGTKAVEDQTFLKELLRRHGSEKIVVGVDVRNGTVATAGWTKDSSLDYLAFIESIRGIGVRYIIVTDITRDGTLTTPNWDMYAQIQGMRIIVSGGVSCSEDIQRAQNYYGIIVGKAYYEGKVDLEACLKREVSRKKESFPV